MIRISMTESACAKSNLRECISTVWHKVDADAGRSRCNKQLANNAKGGVVKRCVFLNQMGDFLAEANCIGILEKAFIGSCGHLSQLLPAVEISLAAVPELPNG